MWASWNSNLGATIPWQVGLFRTEHLWPPSFQTDVLPHFETLSVWLGESKNFTCRILNLDVIRFHSRWAENLNGSVCPEKACLSFRKWKEQNPLKLNVTEEIVYCAAPETDYSCGLRSISSDTRPDLLGNSRKGIHFCRHPDVLAAKLTEGGHNSTSTLVLQCKVWTRELE